MGDLDTGEGGVVIPGAGSYSVGLDFDRRSGYLFVRGGLTGDHRAVPMHALRALMSGRLYITPVKG